MKSFVGKGASDGTRNQWQVFSELATVSRQGPTGAAAILCQDLFSPEQQCPQIGFGLSFPWQRGYLLLDSLCYTLAHDSLATWCWCRTQGGPRTCCEEGMPLVSPEKGHLCIDFCFESALDRWELIDRWMTSAFCCYLTSLSIIPPRVIGG